MINPSTILEGLGITLAKPSEKFVAWLEDRFPEWKLSSTFCSCVPKDHSRLAIGDHTWGYLWMESRIMLNADKIH